MILFCSAVILYTSFLFSDGSKSMKNKFKGSFVILCCAFSMFRALCPSSSISCHMSSMSVEWWRCLMTIL